MSQRNIWERRGKATKAREKYPGFACAKNLSFPVQTKIAFQESLVFSHRRSFGQSRDLLGARVSLEFIFPG